MRGWPALRQHCTLHEETLTECHQDRIRSFDFKNSDRQNTNCIMLLTGVGRALFVWMTVRRCTQLSYEIQIGNQVQLLSAASLTRASAANLGDDLIDRSGLSTYDEAVDAGPQIGRRCDAYAILGCRSPWALRQLHRDAGEAWDLVP